MSDQQSEVVTGLPSMGRELRRAREARGDSIQDVADAIKLNPRQVIALEQERFDELPGRAFARGFLRNYARHIGLDVDRMMARFDEAGGSGSRELDELVGPGTSVAGTVTLGGDSPRRRASGGNWGAILLGLLVLGAVGWHFDWFSLRNAGFEGNGLQVAEPATPGRAVAVAPPATQTPAAVSAPVVAQTAPQGDVTSLVTDPAAPTTVATLPADAAQATALQAPVVAVATTDAPATTPAAGEAAPATMVVASGSDLVFTLSGESWMQVRDADGATLYMGTSGAGTTRTVSGKAPFSLVIGNATNVNLQRGGVQVDLAPHTRGSVARLTLP